MNAEDPQPTGGRDSLPASWVDQQSPVLALFADPGAIGLFGGDVAHLRDRLMARFAPRTDTEVSVLDLLVLDIRSLQYFYQMLAAITALPAPTVHDAAEIERAEVLRTCIASLARLVTACENGSALACDGWKAALLAEFLSAVIADAQRWAAEGKPDGTHSAGTDGSPAATTEAAAPTPAMSGRRAAAQSGQDEAADRAAATAATNAARAAAARDFVARARCVMADARDRDRCQLLLRGSTSLNIQARVAWATVFRRALSEARRELPERSAAQDRLIKARAEHLLRKVEDLDVLHKIHAEIDRLKARIRHGVDDLRESRKSSLQTLTNLDEKMRQGSYPTP